MQWRLVLSGVVVMSVLAACSAPVPTPTPAVTPAPPVGSSVSGLILKMSPAQMAAQSTDIVVGRVTETRSEWNADHTHVHTLVTLAVDERVKGSSGSTVVLDVPGGTVGTVSEWVEDSPRFTVGERALVFTRAEGNAFSVVGGVQGKRSVDASGYIAGTRTSLADFIGQIRGERSEGTGGSARPVRR